MNIEKRASGQYRARVQINKKRYTATFDHKPTESEVWLALSDKINTTINCKKITFELAAKEYCKIRKNVLSPTTYREYCKTSSRLSEEFQSLNIGDITASVIQCEINYLSATRSAKTVKNYYNFIVSVIRMYRPDFKVYVKLPNSEKKETYIPTDEEIHKLIEYAKTTKEGIFYVPIVLACYGMRRSEICAITSDDIKGNIVCIRKAKVMDIDNKWIIKPYPNNETSNRDVPIPNDIAEKIIAQGYAYNGTPNGITDFITDFCKKYNINHFSVHKLRHYFCSRLSAENIDTETIISLSGHKTDYVMKSIYRHKIEEKVVQASDRLNEILFSNNQ